MKNWFRGSTAIVGFAALMLFVGGCDKAADAGNASKAGGKPVAVKGDDKKTDDSKHSGWWCDEHGVPEAECSQCNAKVAAELKKKGDWCDKHDRAMSQCFICNPKLKEKFAARYRAQYGKEPPPLEEEKDSAGKDKKDDKK